MFKSGGAVERIGTGRPSSYAHELALTATSIFFVTEGNALARMPKSGGSPISLSPSLPSYPGSLIADERGVVAQTPDLVIRCNADEPCVTEPVKGHDGRKLTMDADWLYYRRPISGHGESLVRARRRGGAPGAYEVLAHDVGGYSFIVVDDARVYFTIASMDGQHALASVSKVPGGSVTVLNPDLDVVGAGLVDDYWLYVAGRQVLAIPKDGSRSDPVVVGDDTHGVAPATDGTCVYWSGGEGGIYAAPVPTRR